MNKSIKCYLHENNTDIYSIDLNMPTEYPAIKARSTEEGGVRDRFFAAKAELPDEITVVHPFSVNGFDNNINTVYYISEKGNDDFNGSIDSPLATLSEALRRVRNIGGAKIVLRGGYYNLSKPIVITSEHSGTEASPLIITAYNNEIPYLSVTPKISAAAFSPVPDGHMKNRLKKEARDKVLVCDLPSIGITEYGKVDLDGTKLVINSRPMTLARYPDIDAPLLHVNNNIYSYGMKEPWEIGLEDTTCLQWEWNDELYIHGALCYEWTRLCKKIGGFDSEKKSVYGIGKFGDDPVRYDPLNTYFFENVFEELDTPGEWYLDRREGKLYLYPPNGKLSEADDIRLVNKPCDVIVCRCTENVIINGLDIGRCSGRAINVNESRFVLIQRCHIIGTSPAEGTRAAVEITGGFRNGIIASHFEYFSNMACFIDGGIRRILKPSNNFIQNCTLDNPYCRIGIFSSGCGNIVSHNYLYNTTLMDSGHNEGIIEYNIGEGGDTETRDTGMIYVGGGGCSSCANHYRYNYFHDMVMGEYVIYFDDLSRGMYAYGNIVVGNGNRIGGSRSYNVHNGGEHCFFNNISIDAGFFAFGGDTSYYVSDSAWNSMYPGILEASLDKRTECYMGRNPTYRDYVAAVDEYIEDIKNPDYVTKSGKAELRLRKPWCNNYENNVIVRANLPFKLDQGLESATCLDTNYITDEDPGFTDFEGKDYTIRKDAPLYK